jgi:transcriptional regulator with XRE-family HTH domain
MTRPVNPTADWLTQPGGLAERLRSARLRAGITGVQLAEANGWPASKISKLENGRQSPTTLDIQAWTTTCGAETEADELVAMLDRVQARHQDWRRRIRSGQIAVQAGYNAMIRDARVVRDFATVYVPSLLQTAQYARFPIAEGVALHGARADEVDAAVTARLQRQQFLYDPSKRFEFLLAEPVLRWLVCTADVMRGQLDRLQTVVGVPNIRLGVLPMGTPLSIAPQNSFAIVGTVVLVETFVGETIHVGDHVAAYTRVLDRLWEQAVEGEEARRLIVKAVDSLPEIE